MDLASCIPSQATTLIGTFDELDEEDREVHESASCPEKQDMNSLLASVEIDMSAELRLPDSESGRGAGGV